MNSIAKFNKHISELHISILKEFTDKIKLEIPQQFHHIIDQHCSEDIEKVKLTVKNIHKKSKSDKPKKPKKISAYNAFTTHRLKELKGNKPTDGDTNMGICAKEWNIIKLNGQFDIWQQKADQRNEELSGQEEQSGQSELSEQEEQSEQEDKEDKEDKPKKKTKPQTKPKVQKKPKAQKKKAQQSDNDEDSDQDIQTENLPELSMSD